MTRNADIAKILGRTEASNASNAALGTGSGGGLTAYDSAGLLPGSATAGTMAYAQNNNYFYIYDSNDSLWAKVGLTAAHSTTSLINSNRSSGIYSFLDPGTGTTKSVYFDASTGYALYSSFGTNNTYDNSTSYPAWNGNGIKFSQLSTYGYNANNPHAWHDGTSQDPDYGSYTILDGYIGFFGSGSDAANFDMTSWNGPSDVSHLRVVWGTGSGSHGSDVDLIINGTTVVDNAGNTENIYTGSFSRTGSTPLLRVHEGESSIAGISQIWFRNTG